MTPTPLLLFGPTFLQGRHLTRAESPLHEGSPAPASRPTKTRGGPLGPGGAGRLAAREFEELIRAPDRPIHQPRLQNRAFGMRPTYNTDAVDSRP